MSSLHISFRRSVSIVLFAAAIPLSAATRTVTSINDSGEGSLRQALLDAQAGDVVAFAIPGGSARINLLTSLPAPAGCIAIDGSTQPGYAGYPLIAIDGASIVESDSVGLAVCGQVHGLAIDNFKRAAIRIVGDTRITGCNIGTSPHRGTPFLSGIENKGCRLQLGGPNPGDRNTISWSLVGVKLSNLPAEPVVIQGNRFVDTAGTAEHVYVTGSRDGTVTISDNFFQGGQTGIRIVASSHVSVVSNELRSMRNLVIAEDASDNLIRQNILTGGTRAVVVTGDSIRNVISYNAMYGNVFDIDLSPALPYDGHTANDATDKDPGPNNLINHPVITSAIGIGESRTVAGTLSAAPTRTYTIELFRATCGHTGYGGSDELLDWFTVTTDDAGNAAFERAIANLSPGTTVTATATHPAEGTSEYSACRAVEGAGQFSFATQWSGGTEGGSLAIPIRRAGGAIGTATVDVVPSFVASNPAKPGDDYTLASTRLSFGPGETVKELIIRFPDDKLYEGNEYILLVLSSPTGGATVGSPSAISVSVGDNDPLPVITAPSVSVDEGDAGERTVVIPITLSSPAGFTLSMAALPYGNGSASQGQDFAYFYETITFAPGETQKTLTLKIYGDTKFEYDEYFGVGIFTYGSSTSLNVYIRNDDPFPSVSVEDATVIETDDGTAVEVAFTLTEPLNTWVNYTVTGVTATPESDFVPRSGRLYFYTSKRATVTIPIVGDDDPEPDETFEISITSTPYAVARRVATVTIRNDDEGFGPRDQTIAVGETGSFVIDIGQARGQPLAIALGSSDPEALAVPKEVILPAGRHSVMFAAKALQPGRFVYVGVELPPELGGERHTVRAWTHTKTGLIFQPEQLAMYVGQTATVRVKVEPPASETLLIPLTADDSVAIPPRISIPPGQTASFEVEALQEGPLAIRATLPRDYGGREVPLFGNVRETPVTPVILRIAPPDGPSAGGTDVTVEGTAFTADCVLTFGGTPATSLHVVAPSLMTATTPPHAPGVVDVTLTCGSLSATVSSGFNYVDSSPTVSFVAPSTGSAAGGTHVRITGGALRSSCWPSFDGSPAPSAVLESPSALLAVTPPHAAGSVDVRLRCTGGETVAEDAFLYVASEEPAASIMTVTPLAAAPGEQVRITGARFRPSDRVAFGNTGASIIRSAPDEHVAVVPELPAGRVSVDLTDAIGRMITTGPIFAVLEASPRIGDVSPGSAPAGAEIELKGTGFRRAYRFEIGGKVAAVAELSFTRAVVRLPEALAPGQYQIQVVNAAGVLASIGPTVTVIEDGLLITGLSARCATTDGGEELTITGRGFEGAMLVTFGTRFADAALVVDANKLLVTIPENAAGPIQIRVTRSDGATATWTGGFRYASPFDPNGCSGDLRGGRAIRH